MKSPLSWLVGRALTEVVRYEYSWSFVFGDIGSVSSGGAFWRLVAPKGIIVTSEDDGHPFGLGHPVDARERVLDRLRGATVTKCSIAEITSDLIIQFPEDVQLHFLNTSCGYESWMADYGPSHTVCLGGGGVASVDMNNLGAIQRKPKAEPDRPATQQSCMAEEGRSIHKTMSKQGPLGTD